MTGRNVHQVKYWPPRLRAASTPANTLNDREGPVSLVIAHQAPKHALRVSFHHVIPCRQSSTFFPDASKVQRLYTQPYMHSLKRFAFLFTEDFRVAACRDFLVCWLEMVGFQYGTGYCACRCAMMWIERCLLLQGELGSKYGNYW